MAGKTYPVGLVGEASYQSAIARCREGMVVELLCETGNPHDSQALRIDADGKTIGYIGRDHWLREAVHGDGKSIEAVIASIDGAAGRRGIVLAATLVPGPPSSSAWQPRQGPARTTRTPLRRKTSSVWAQLFKALLGGQR